VIREMGRFLRLAQKTGKRLPTLSIDTEVRFRTAADRAAFTQELTDAVTKLVSRYHDATVAGGRAHRLVALAYPNRCNPKQRNHHELKKDRVGTSLGPGRSRSAGPPKRSGER